MRENRSYGLMRGDWETSPLLYSNKSKIYKCNIKMGLSHKWEHLRDSPFPIIRAETESLSQIEAGACGRRRPLSERSRSGCACRFRQEWQDLF